VGDQTVSNPVVNNDTYHYFLVVSLSASVGGAALDERLYAVVVFYQEPLSVSAPLTSGPAADERALAHPNPFRTRSDVRFSLPGPETVDVTVFDVSGRLLRNLHSGRLDSGVHDVSWDGRDRAGRRVAGGVYYVRVRSATRDLVTRMVRVE
jgi:hypothetical protein